MKLTRLSIAFVLFSLCVSSADAGVLRAGYKGTRKSAKVAKSVVKNVAKTSVKAIY